MATMQEQFESIKKQYPDALLLFRCGDFYEAYDQDAVDACDILKITLTTRGSKGTHMCGFPSHALDAYLPKLVKAGKRVAICDQLNAPKDNAPAVKPEFLKNMEENAKQLKLSLFEPAPSEDLLRYRDKVAMEILVRNFGSCSEEDAARAANTLVYRLYGYKLSVNEGAI